MAATIYDVAEYAGVSVGTVSRYLNGHKLRDANQTRVRTAIDKLGFRGNRLARSLRMQKTSMIGILVPSLHDPLVNSIVTGVEQELRQAGLNDGRTNGSEYSFLIADYANDPELLVQRLRELVTHMVDGIVLFPRGAVTHVDLSDEQIPAPVVVVDEDLPHFHCDKVLLDNVGSSYQATNSLIERGHRKIAIINGRRDSTVSLQRFEGYRGAMADAGIPEEHGLIEWGEFSTHGGYIATRRLIERDAPPTALLVTNYDMTLGTVMATYEMNVRIPAFLSLIGFGNFQLSDIARPPLTVIEQPVEQMSKTIAEVLRKRIVGTHPSAPETIEFTARLIVRESTRFI